MLSLTTPMLHSLKEAPEELRMAAPSGEYLRKRRVADNCDRDQTLQITRSFTAPARWSALHYVLNPRINPCPAENQNF